MFNDRKMQEQKLALEAVNTLAAEDYKAWHDGKATCRAMAYVGKEFVIYRLVDGKPILVDSLICTGVSLSINDGLSSTWQAAEKGLIEVGHVPTHIYPGIFLWHTFLSEVQFIPVNCQYAARFSVLFKCAEHPRDEVSDTLYIQEKNRVIVGVCK